MKHPHQSNYNVRLIKKIMNYAREFFAFIFTYIFAYLHENVHSTVRNIKKSEVFIINIYFWISRTRNFDFLDL